MSLVKLIDIANEKVLSSIFEQSDVHDAFQFRVLRRSRLLAHYLFQTSGDWGEKEAENALHLLSGDDIPFPYVLSPRDREYCIRAHAVIAFIHKDKEVRLLLRRLTFPLANPFLETLVRRSMLLPPDTKLEAKIARMSLVSALLTPIRQSVGSCFSTAPAIMLQNEAIGKMTEDLYDILTTGRLKRVVNDEEYKVPMSVKTGHGDIKKTLKNAKIAEELPTMRHAIHNLPGSIRQEWFPCTIEDVLHHLSQIDSAQVRKITGAPPSPFDTSHQTHWEEVRHREKRMVLLEEAIAQYKSFTEHPLLKIWEYTLASFSDFKVEFAQWNVFASLGFDHTEPGGIGEFLYRLVHEKLEHTQEAIKEQKKHVIIAQEQMQGTMALLNRADSLDKARRLQVELQLREHQWKMFRDEYQSLVEDAEHCARFYQFFIDQLLFFFPQYFQELYDPEMYRAVYDIYEDMPAGFRLVYKHGRHDPSVWTTIEDADEYIKSLTDFIRMIEPQMIAACEWKEGKEVLPRICQGVIDHLATPDFLLQGSRRIAKMHREHVKGVPSFISEGTSWAYSSGGSLPTLLRCYFGLHELPQRESITPRNPEELLVFCIELLKDLPLKTTEKFLQDPLSGLLATSPVHAFALRPGREGFVDAWEDGGNSHTWLRDHFFQKEKNFYLSVVLTHREQTFLLENIGIRDTRRFAENLYLREFFLLLKEQYALTDTSIHSYLRSSLPIISLSEAEMLIGKFADYWNIDANDIDGISRSVKQDYYRYVHFHAFLEKLLLGYTRESDTFYVVKDFLREQGYSAPSPFILGDSNWPHFDSLAIALSPGTDLFDIWQCDSSGYRGVPLVSWRKYFGEGSLWTVYTDKSHL